MDTNLYETGLHLWARWTEMWNGRPELARDLVAPRFALHLPPPSAIDPATVTDPEAVVRWVAAHRARHDSLRFTYEAGPFVDTVRSVVAGPWVARAVVQGAPTQFCGMDTIAFREGRITEYWTVAKVVDDVGHWAEALLELPRIG